MKFIFELIFELLFKLIFELVGAKVREFLLKKKQGEHKHTIAPEIDILIGFIVLAILFLVPYLILTQDVLGWLHSLFDKVKNHKT